MSAGENAVAAPANGDFLIPFPFSTADRERLIADFQGQMRCGLAADPGSIAMRASFVSRPTGAERGLYAALDLGGANVRATLIALPGGGRARVLRRDAFRLPTITGSASDLFDPVAEFIGGVLDEGSDYGLGFIFSFPIDQNGVRAGRLSRWTKEFAFSGVEGEEVVALLEHSIARKAAAFPSLRRLSITALANDTVGVLAAGAYLDPRCDIGLIVGTGCNLAVAVPERLIDRDDLPSAPGRPGEMIFNMECGNFDAVRSIQTDHDIRLDAGSGARGEQLLEKMISGRYLGEIVRQIVESEASEGGPFSGWLEPDSAFAAPYGFGTENMADIAYDTSEDLAATSMTLKSLGAPDSTLEARWRLRELCLSAITRSARLVAMAIAATALYIDPDLDREHVVSADGSVFRDLDYQRQIERELSDVLGHRADRVRLAYLRDGSSLGAAILAASVA